MHPEKLENEVFLGNVDRKTGIPDYLSHFHSIRTGEIAFDLNDEVIEDMVPMFIHKSQIDSYNSLMDRRVRETFSGIRNSK